MEANYFKAFERHLRDAEILFAKSKWANADLLYGYSVECGLKCLMVIFGMRLEQGGMGKPRERDDRVHADKIWARYHVYRSGYGSAKYALSQQNPFANWDVSDRYADESGFDQPHVEPHKNAAAQVKSLLRQAERDGLI
jgi:hypothetical protein